MSPAVIMKGFLVTVVVAVSIVYWPGIKHLQETSTTDTALLHVEKAKLATGVVQAGITTSSATKEARQQYFESLMNDYDKLSLSVKKGDVVATAKAARYLLCSVSGWEDWARQSRKGNILLNAAPMKALLKQISSTANPEIQKQVFRQLSTLVEELSKQLM